MTLALIVIWLCHPRLLHISTCNVPYVLPKYLKNYILLFTYCVKDNYFMYLNVRIEF